MKKGYPKSILIINYLKMSVKPYTIIKDPNEKTLETIFNNAFKSKVGKDVKEVEADERTHRFPKNQNHLHLHQIFHPNTWLIDLVKFDDFWYVFFVEANTRYLIVVQGNSDFLTNDATSTEVQPKKRVKTDIFMDVFKRFQEINGSKPIYKIIGDSERAFWSKSMMTYYKENNILIEKINVSKEGHVRLGILDRLVRTIRQMCYNAELSELVIPTEMIKIVLTYNNTQHSVFYKYAKIKATPLEVHNNPDLEKRFIQGLISQNEKTAQQDTFYLDTGTPVIVKAPTPEIFSKNKQPSMKGIYYVEKRYDDGKYVVKNKRSGKVIENVPRRNLVPHH